VINAIHRRVWWQQILVIIAVSICYIQLAGIIGTKVLVPIIGWDGSEKAIGDLAVVDSIAGRFARWDSGYYLYIAQYGYRSDGAERAFFPLYPMVVRFVSNLSGLSLLWSGLLVSITCFVCACIVLYKWVLIDYQQEVAIWSVIWLCCFPMAFFLIAFYAEALFLMLCIFSAYYQFLVCGVTIALAGATRSTAFLLAVLFFVEFWQQRNFKKIQLAKTALGALIAPLGALAYSVFLSITSGNINVFGIYTANQSAEWKRTIVWPWLTFYDGISAAVFGKGINSDWFSRAIAWQDLAYASLGMVCAVYSLFRLRLSAALFFLSSMIFLYANHGPYGYAFWSMPRYVASLFPIYLILALVTTTLPIWL